MRRTLLKQLADGRFHDGDDLCRALDITPGELWRALNTLADVGVTFEAAPAKGYRLTAPMELLDRARIAAALAGAPVSPGGIEVLDEIDSTNRYLLDKVRGGLSAGHACLAECQSAGHGRRGRPWASPYGRNLYLSLSWEYPGDTATLSALGVACAVAVARALRAAGLIGLGLKWPNDILWRGRKLGGVLLEVADARGRPCRGVIGVGVNVGMPADAAQSIDQPWADVRSALDGDISRNRLAVLVLEQLLAAVAQYRAAGLSPFIEEWRQYDIMPGRTAVLRWPNGQVTGVVQGIDALGELLLSVGGEVRSYCYGEVSLRAEPGASV